MATLKTRGLVIKRRAYGEADRILTILAPGLGKITAIAKGARRPGSKLGGHLELFYLVDWVLAEGRTWHIVSNADLVEPFRQLRTALPVLEHASHAARLADRLSPEGESAPRVYDLIVNLFYHLHADAAPLLLRLYEWQLLLAVGFQPQLASCSHCSSALDATQLGLCPDRGGALCPSCLRNEQIHIPVSPNALKVLRLFERAPMELATRLTVGDDVLQELARINRAFLEHSLELPLAAMVLPSAEVQHAVH